MIKIVTHIPKDSTKYIRRNDIFFSRDMLRHPFDSTDEALMKKIDSATLIDKEHGIVKTPYGVTLVNNLSTGLKTALNIRYMMKNMQKYNGYSVSITECGANAINEILQMGDVPFDLVLNHIDLYGVQGGIPVNFNGKVIDSGDLLGDVPASMIGG